jgi:hypothetical protein
VTASRIAISSEASASGGAVPDQLREQQAQRRQQDANDGRAVLTHHRPQRRVARAQQVLG